MPVLPTTVSKRIPLAVLAAGSLVLGACSDGGASQEPLESLTIMAPFFSPTPPGEDDPIDEALSEIAGLDLSVQWVPNSDYGAKTNTVLAGDDIPDVMVIQGKDQAFVQTAEAGGFWDLTEHLASGDYPNLVTENPEVQEASSVNGKVYGVYRARDVIRASVIVRQDWLDNLGLALPETTDDLYELARAFTEDDPDGNGEDDTYGMINPAWGGLGNGSPYDAMEVWHGSGNLWRDEGGELVPSFTTPEWNQALQYERDLVQNGYVNPDYATMDPATWNEPFLNGEGGIILDVQSRAIELVKLFKEQDPENFDQYVALGGQLDGPNGTFAMPTAGYSGFLAVPRSGVQNEDQLKQVLTALNELNTTEAQNLMNHGIEGDNYTLEEGGVVFDPAKQDFTDQVTGAWAQLGTNVAGYNAHPFQRETEFETALDQLRLDLMAEDVANAVYNPAAGFVSPTYTTSGAQLDTIIVDARIQYIAGQIDDAGLQAAIETWRSSGGDDVIQEVNDLYAELN
ncbi:extracellular solute-binding protein [Glycomyces harbinensis]|uniref:Putative aldouronate transport system substrate-binding protein n=1 Tax=Glycomyces harbinensis TaxID=58114 RepID=A0A1G7ARD3_9ACTN|nr:extracellular solute-binding protein [Glycomyces harbinensis]SDE16476.1 putative aldouronate transport system substrate-binding protein [Glycomyces harbinensis]